MSYCIAGLWILMGLWGYLDFCRWQRMRYPEDEKFLTPFWRDFRALICMLGGPLIFVASILPDRTKP